MQTHDRVNQPAGAHVQKADDDHHEQHEKYHDHRIIDQLFASRPCDLLQFMPHVLERVADLCKEFDKTLAEADEEVFLLALICHGFPILSQTRDGRDRPVNAIALVTYLVSR